MKFKERIVDVEAFQNKGKLLFPAMKKGYDEKVDVPEWVESAYVSGKIYFDSFHGVEPPRELFIMRPDGERIHVPVGYYIIRESIDLLHSCEPKLFEFLYMPMNDEGIKKVKPIKTIEEIMETDSWELTSEEAKRLDRVKRIPLAARDLFLTIEESKRKMIIKLEKERDAILDYLNGFTDGTPE